MYKKKHNETSTCLNVSYKNINVQDNFFYIEDNHDCALKSVFIITKYYNWPKNAIYSVILKIIQIIINFSTDDIKATKTALTDGSA